MSMKSLRLKMMQPKFNSGRQTFPFKLWTLINSPDKNGVEWSSDGSDVVIYKKLFVQKCLGMKGAFKTYKFLSITKQLNVYGFTQLNCDKASNSRKFNSPYFKRDKPDLLEKFTRKVACPIKQEKKTPKKSAMAKQDENYKRRPLACISNVNLEKTRAQPMRMARLVKKPVLAESPIGSLSSNSVKATSPKTSSLKPSLSPRTIPLCSPKILRRPQRQQDPVAEARVYFYQVLQQNVLQVINLPTGLTSSSGSSSIIFTDVTDMPVKYPAPKRKDPKVVMWNGNCPPTPSKEGASSLNPNAFITSPWKEYINMKQMDVDPGY